MMGRGYVIEHCIAAANYEEKQRVYRLYDSECCRMVTECMATVVTILSRGEIQLPYMAKPIMEVFEPQKEPENEKKLTAEQVIADIMADLGKKNQAGSPA